MCIKKHGLRNIRIEENPLDKESKSFTFVLNGNPVFVKGVNMNMLPVWGGGVYESEVFMNGCDKSGIKTKQIYV